MKNESFKFLIGFCIGVILALAILIYYNNNQTRFHINNEPTWEDHSDKLWSNENPIHGDTAIVILIDDTKFDTLQWTIDTIIMIY